MAHRLLVQVIITGTQVFGKAFAEAYKQASSASARAGATATVRQKTGGITYDEACKILDVDQNNLPGIEKLDAKYQHLFNANSKDKGGSFYLQSKVFRSMERIKYELEKQGKPTSVNGGETASSASAGETQAKS